MQDFKFNDCHLHFHDPNMTNKTILDIIHSEFPHIKSFYEKPDDNSALLGMLDAINCEQAWIINYESDVVGYSLSTNDWVANFCENSNNRLIAIGGIDPAKHDNAAEIMRDYIERGMIKGIKIHGPHQLLYHNQYTNGLKAQKDLYAMCEEMQVPVMWHTGSSIFPNARSKYGNPLTLEDVLIDFPDIIPIMCHGGRPFWTREAEYLMIKFDKLYLDISGVPPHLLPKYFPRFDRYAERVIFGSDYPSPGTPSPRKNAEAIKKLPLSRKIIDMILYENTHSLMR